MTFAVLTKKNVVYLNVFISIARLSKYVTGAHRVRKNAVKSRKIGICQLFSLHLPNGAAKTHFLILFNLTIEKICEIRYNIP